MGCARENADLWYCLKHDRKRIRKIFRSNYFWQDTLWTPVNRFIGCKLFGHRNKIWVEGDEYYTDDLYCFNCYTKLDTRTNNRNLPPVNQAGKLIGANDGSK